MRYSETIVLKHSPAKFARQPLDPPSAENDSAQYIVVEIQALHDSLDSKLKARPYSKYQGS